MLTSVSFVTSHKNGKNFITTIAIGLSIDKEFLMNIKWSSLLFCLYRTWCTQMRRQAKVLLCVRLKCLLNASWCILLNYGVRCLNILRVNLVIFADSEINITLVKPSIDHFACGAGFPEKCLKFKAFPKPKRPKQPYWN